MRFLGIGPEADLAGMYHRLIRAGHEVRMFVEAVEAQGIHAGMVPRTDDWRNDLAWIRAAGSDGVIVFESADRGDVQDALRRDGYRVIGGSAFGDRLESDRNFGQDQLAGHGLRCAQCWRFTDFSAAVAFVRSQPARYVFKSNGANSLRTRNYIGQTSDGSDMIALLATYARQWRHGGGVPDFILMQHISGVEVGVGAYFNGEHFLQPACLDWEHKRFFTGELGELTGEMGTIVTYRGAERIFEATLAHMTASLRDSGYCGYINLNLMANDEGLWPIEFTSRFGYPGYAICEALHAETWDRIFTRLLDRDGDAIVTHAGYAAGVVLTVPPFPYRHGYEQLSKGLPISFSGDISVEERNHLHLAEAALEDGQLVTSGMIGYVGVATGTGPSVAQARERAYALAGKVIVPNLRYRVDIGDRVIAHDLAALAQMGWLS